MAYISNRYESSGSKSHVMHRLLEGPRPYACKCVCILSLRVFFKHLKLTNNAATRYRISSMV
jgi:hypothetical protein